MFIATPYESQTKEIVHELKYEYARAHAKVVASVLARRLPETLHPTVITYVPTATSRVRARGYDHAKLIAQAVAKHFALPCLPLLARLGQQRQVGQKREVRTKQLKGAFRAINSNCIQNERVLLIDDVITTGATLESAAHALHAAGAEQVSAAVFARNQSHLD